MSNPIESQAVITVTFFQDGVLDIRSLNSDQKTDASQVADALVELAAQLCKDQLKDFEVTVTGGADKGSS